MAPRGGMHAARESMGLYEWRKRGRGNMTPHGSDAWFMVHERIMELGWGKRSYSGNMALQRGVHGARESLTSSC